MTKNSLHSSTVLFRRKPPATQETIVLGITGGIACGKSLICHFFRELGATVLSADELAREVVAPGEMAFQKIVAHFGEEILTRGGEINRPCLAEKIFFSPAERQELNKIMHPAIGRLAKQRLNKLRQRENIPLIIYEAPLLCEACAEHHVDLILVVSTTPKQQLQRLMRRDSLPKEEALKRISAQMPLAEKISRSDIVIENNGPPEETKKIIGRIYAELTELKKKSPPNPGDL